MIQYVSEDNLQLNPALPMNQRSIQIRLRSSALGNLEGLMLSSNLPNGRAEYKKRWKLSDKAVRADNLKVYVDNVLVSSGYILQGNEVVFDHAPKAGSKVKVSYEHAAIKDSLMLQPVVFNGSVDSKTLKVYFNNVLASGQDFVLEKNLEKQFTLRPSDLALNALDKFGIRAAGQLKIKVENKK